MRRLKLFRTWIAVAALSFALVVVIVLNSACSCLPTVYEEVDLAAVPARVLEKARSSAPGRVLHRAWKFAPGGRFETEGIMGYLLRRRVHWYESRDIEVYLSDPDPGPDGLRPVE